MARNFAVYIVELLLAGRGNCHGYRYKITFTTNIRLHELVGNGSYVTLNQRSRRRSEFRCVPTHHLDGELTRKLDYRFFAHIVKQ